MYEATRQRIGEIIGEASMCWSETPRGVFNSDRASELTDEVMTHIQYPLENTDDKKELNQSISEELEVRFKEIHMFLRSVEEMEGEGDILFENLMRKIRNKISQAIAEERKELREKINELFRYDYEARKDQVLSLIEEK